MAYEVPPLPVRLRRARAAHRRGDDAASTTTSTTRPTSTRPTPRSRAPSGTASRSRTSSQNLVALPADKRGAVRNNGGGHYNHTLFWESHEPGRRRRARRRRSATAIDAAFGSFDDFKAKFKDAGVSQFGSGWAWLVHDGSGLAVVGTPNQDNPISEGQTPLLGVDVWEHAYYLKYQNKRPDYLDAWWNVVDWDKVAERFGAVA